MTDIAALIERLKAIADGADIREDQRAEIHQAAHALSRLTTPPPDEIARLIERWEKRIAWTAKWEIDDRLDNDTLAALRALAQERDAIRRKTIEECLAAVSNVHGYWQAIEALRSF